MSDWNSIPCRMSDFDEHLFGRGIHYEIYKKLGAHPGEMLGQCGTFFSLWAPHAEKVSVAGDFNDWDPEKNYLKKTREMGIFEQFVPGARPGQQYLFCITAKDGRVFWKADPYAFSAQLRSEHDSGPKVQDKKIRKQSLYVFKNPIALIHNNVLPSGCS